MDRFTATLAVCLVAAIFTAGALLLNPSPATSKTRNNIDRHAAFNVKRETPPRSPIATPFSSSIA